MIIGFTGMKGSGKNTAANFVAEQYKDKLFVRQFAFATKLKESAAACFGIPKEQAVKFCDEIKNTGKIELYEVGPNVGPRDPGYWLKATGREFLQYYGTEAHRDVFGEDFWVDELFKDIDNYAGYTAWEERLDLITDVRFPNEVAAIRERNGKVIQISRPTSEDYVPDSHSSEKPLGNIDKIVYNNDSLGVLRFNVLRVVEGLLPLRKLQLT